MSEIERISRREFLQALELRVWIVLATIIALVLAARQLRLWLQLRRGTYQITRDDGSTWQRTGGPGHGELVIQYWLNGDLHDYSHQHGQHHVDQCECDRSPSE